MGTFLMALGIVLLVVAGMSVGVIMGRKPISGTCGGLNNRSEGGACEICGGNPNKCEESPGGDRDGGNPALGYDATRD